MNRVFFSIQSAIAVILVSACATEKPAIPFPSTRTLIDSTVRPVGNGSCVTNRTRLWEVEGGLVVEIQMPANRCSFESLTLVTNSARYPLSAVDGNFQKSTYYNGAINVPAYRWAANPGRLFFKTDQAIKTTEIRGILEPSCSGRDCLNEASALLAK